MLKQLAFIVLVIQILLSSCESNTSGKKIDARNLPHINVDVKRYGEALFELDTSNLSQGLKAIKPKFNFFLDADLDDENNVGQIHDFITDTSLIRIYDKSKQVYPDNEFLNRELSSAFKYYKYYFPDEKLPEVYTYISGLQYESPVWVQDSVMIIALDIYLGNDFEPYFGLGLPQYKILCMRPENLVVDVIKYFYHQNLQARAMQKTLLDRMVAGGKLLYFLDRILPETADSIKICYTDEKLNWAINNEESVWAFMIENDLLFSTDYQSQTKLIKDGPFTTGLSRQSPARLGIWIGWQIVKDFMKNNSEVSLQELLLMTDSQELLHKSAYKP